MTSNPQRSLVFVESPYSGDIDRHIRYLLLCNYDCWARAEYPVNSHGNMTQHPAKSDFFVSDYEPEWDIYTREEAIEGSHVLRNVCNKTIFYEDLGWSSGMKYALEYCKTNSIPFEIRKLNIQNVLSLHAQLLSKQFIVAILTGQNYTQFLHGTSLITE